MQPLLSQQGQDTYQEFVAIHRQIRCNASATAAQAVVTLLNQSPGAVQV
jgi:lipid-A-disaccharide synthase